MNDQSITIGIAGGGLALELSQKTKMKVFELNYSDKGVLSKRNEKNGDGVDLAHGL